MTITLFLQKDTLLRDLQTLQVLFRFKIEMANKLRGQYEPLSITSEKMMFPQVIIQVTPEEFALIGVFNGGL